MIEYKAHDLLHFFGSSNLNLAFYHWFNLEFWQAAIFTFTIGVLWEVCDELYKRGIIKGDFDNIWDKRGWDSMDIVRNFLGIGLSITIK